MGNLVVDLYSYYVLQYVTICYNILQYIATYLSLFRST